MSKCNVDIQVHILFWDTWMKISSNDFALYNSENRGLDLEHRRLVS